MLPSPPRVFTDYSRTTETGGFLRLELNTFATFAVDARTGKELDEVDAVEVCLVLALFGKTDQSVPSKRAPKACSSKASQSLSNTQPLVCLLQIKLWSFVFLSLTRIVQEALSA